MDLRQWFQGKRVTVMGLGFHGGGLGVTRWLCELGAQVTVTDFGTEEKLKDSLLAIKDLPIKLVLGKHEERDFIETDLVVRNPAIPYTSPYLKIAQEHGVPIEMETSLFFRFSPTRNIIAITGTKGKTTTSHLMHHVLQTAGYAAKLAGNMGKSMVELIDQLTVEDWLVLELSSFQCEGFAPHIQEFREKGLGPKYGILTNLFEDHLNRYGTIDEYASAKKQLFLTQNAQQVTVLHQQDAWKEFFQRDLISKVLFAEVAGLAISTYQHAANIDLVVAVAKDVGITEDVLNKAFSTFAPPAHRLELVREVDGVSFYNDSTATNPTAAASGIWELAKQGRAMVAIVGGNDKNMDFEPLIQAVKDTKSKYVLLEGTADEKLRSLPGNLKISAFTDYAEAVQAAFNAARPNGIVTLSPGATSFNMFKDEFDRGDQFKAIVNSL